MISPEISRVKSHSLFHMSPLLPPSPGAREDAPQRPALRVQHLPPEVLPEGADAEAPVAPARRRPLQGPAAPCRHQHHGAAHGAAGPPRRPRAHRVPSRSAGQRPLQLHRGPDQVQQPRDAGRVLAAPRRLAGDHAAPARPATTAAADSPAVLAPVWPGGSVEPPSRRAC